jgi:hypothetical protein
MAGKLHLKLDKGGLHRATHTPSGEKISAYKMAGALHSKNPHMRKMAQFAKNARKWNHKGRKK